MQKLILCFLLLVFAFVDIEKPTFQGVPIERIDAWGRVIRLVPDEAAFHAFLDTDRFVWEERGHAYNLSRNTVGPLSRPLLFGFSIDPNKASYKALQDVPGLGPQKALAIVQYRQKLGGFSGLEELLEVKGIGQKTLASIRPFLLLEVTSK